MNFLARPIELPTELRQLITTEQARHYRILPLQKEGDILTFLTDNKDPGLQYELEILFGCEIRIKHAERDIVSENLARYYRQSEQKRKTEEVSLEADKSEDFVEKLIAEADSLGSSDIHIEAYEEKCRVRLRIDGKLIEKYVLPAENYPALVNKLKIQANLDISEKRLPQDGRIFFEDRQNKFDIRVSVLPTLHGEKIVLRLLSKDATQIDIKSLGFTGKQLKSYLEGAKKPHGIILMSGPTGSGKTTTLYSTLKILNKVDTNIMTIEDPIEYTLEGINQVQLKEDIGLTFAKALRSFLRQDPDVIMLGEIRDGETAQMAIRAALTGHLVLSTIHTNSAWGTISRLTDMGVPPYLLASTMNLTAAQRLVRLLCPHCKKEERFDPALLPRNYKAPKKIEKHFVPVGCEECFYTGYKGRKAIYEIIPVDGELAENIKEEKFNVTGLLKEKKIDRLMDNAFEIFEQGETSVDEVYSILMTSH